MLNYDEALYSLLVLTNFSPLTAKIEPSLIPTLRNHHLLGAGDHYVGLSLGMPTFSLEI